MANKYFVTRGRYTVFSEWCHQGRDDDFIHTIIRPATEDDEKNNGERTVGLVCYTGYSLEIYNTLEEAIYKSGFEKEFWYKIDFEDLPSTASHNAKLFIILANSFPDEVDAEYERILKRRPTHSPTSKDITGFITIPE